MVHVILLTYNPDPKLASFPICAVLRDLANLSDTRLMYYVGTVCMSNNWICGIFTFSCDSLSWDVRISEGRYLGRHFCPIYLPPKTALSILMRVAPANFLDAQSWSRFRIEEIGCNVYHLPSHISTYVRGFVIGARGGSNTPRILVGQARVNFRHQVFSSTVSRLCSICGSINWASLRIPNWTMY